MRYLSVYAWSARGDKPPPKTWAKKPMTYYADRLARKAKNVTAGELGFYGDNGWFLVEVDASSADQARRVLRLALHGSETSQRKIRIIANPYSLLRWDAVRPAGGPPAARAVREVEVGGHTVGLPVEPSSPRKKTRTEVMRSEHASAEFEGLDEHLIRGRPMSEDPIAAIFMGVAPEGVRYVVRTETPFAVGYVTIDPHIRYPSIAVEMISPKPRDLIELARDLAVGFASDNGLFFELYKPSVAQSRRKRLFVDENPNSASFGRNKYGYPTTWSFEVPYSVRRQLPKEQQDMFRYSTDRPRWRPSQAKDFLGISKAIPIR